MYTGWKKWKDELKTCIPTTIILLMGIAFIIFLVPHMFHVSIRYCKAPLILSFNILSHNKNHVRRQILDDQKNQKIRVTYGLAHNAPIPRQLLDQYEI